MYIGVKVLNTCLFHGEPSHYKGNTFPCEHEAFSSFLVSHALVCAWSIQVVANIGV